MQSWIRIRKNWRFQRYWFSVNNSKECFVTFWQSSNLPWCWNEYYKWVYFNRPCDVLFKRMPNALVWPLTWYLYCYKLLLNFGDWWLELRGHVTSISLIQGFQTEEQKMTNELISWLTNKLINQNQLIYKWTGGRTDRWPGTDERLYSNLIYILLLDLN